MGGMVGSFAFIDFDQTRRCWCDESESDSQFSGCKRSLAIRHAVYATVEAVVADKSMCVLDSATLRRSRRRSYYLPKPLEFVQ